MPRFDTLSGRPLRWLLLTTSGVAFLLFGYDQGVMGGLVSLESFLTRFSHPSAALLGFMVASYDVGCLWGALLAFLSGDKFGRRWSIIYSCIVVIIGATLQTSAYSQAQYIVGRIVAGTGVGCISDSPDLCLRGIAISNFTNFGFVYGRPELNGTEAQWRIPIGPRLASVGRTDEVAEVLARLEGSGATRDSEHIKQQAAIIIQTSLHEAEVETSWNEAFSGGELQNFRRLILASTTGFLHQATGINVVIYYAPVIFRGVGLDDRMSYIMSCVGSCCLLVGSVLPVLWIERAGRRKTMIMGAWLCGICMGMIAATGAVSHYYPSRAFSAGWAGAAFVLAFQFSFAIGWNSMNWLYSSEIGSLRMRNNTSASMCLCHWATNFLSVMVAPTGFDSLGWRFYLIWMSVTLAALPFLYFCFLETANRTLEQMDEFFRLYPQWNIRTVANKWVEATNSPASLMEKETFDQSEHVETKTKRVELG